jgi:hypothetical protein
VKNYLIRNQTPHQLVIEGAEATLKLAPLQGRRVGNHPESLFGPAATAARRDHAVDWEVEPVRSTRLLTAAWLAGLGVSAAAGGVLANAVAGSILALWLGIAVGAGCAGAGAYVIGRGRTRNARRPSAKKDQIDASPPHGDTWGLVRDFITATSQGLAGIVLVVVAVAAPASAIYYGTELSQVLVFTTWRHPMLVAGPDARHIVVARLLQLVLLVVVSLVPALMYFQFDREKLTTLVDRWLHAIFRLDPSVETVADVDAKYGRRVEEFYGATLEAGVGAPRKRLQDRSPVVIATLLIALGWIVVLLNDDRGSAELPSFQDLFRPSPTPMTLAFLGAYFLSVQVALRGYVRGDLKPKTYNVIAVRILMAVVLAWVMQALWGTNDVVLALSFIAGVLPNTVLRRIRDVAGRGPGDRGGDLEVRSPLTLLDDVDVYERTRLEEEGITSVQALARHDLVDLILSSRIPVPRLIDWVDQAILQQHAPDAITSLRRVGIRTATDYLQVCADEAVSAELERAVAQSGCLSVPLLRAVLAGDEWLSYIKNWRDHDGTETPEARTYRPDGRLERGHKVAEAGLSSSPPASDDGGLVLSGGVSTTAGRRRASGRARADSRQEAVT